LMGKIGLIVASLRRNSSGAGIARHLSPKISSRLEPKGHTLSVISLRDLKLPPLDDDVMPAAVSDRPSGYPSPIIQQWSTTVSSLSGIVLLTPEYNGGYPASIKNALDHLFHEWNQLPTLIISYGGRGGSRSAEQLRQIVQAGLKMNVLATAPGITLPRAVIAGQTTIDEDPSFLREYEGVIGDEVDALVALIEPSPSEV